MECNNKMNIFLKLITIIFIIFLMFINSILYFDYLNKLDDNKINYLNCEYWNKAIIPDNLIDSHKWKVITTIGECKIYSKKYYLEKYSKYNKEFGPNLKYFNIKHRAKYIGEQAKIIFRYFAGAEK